VAAEARDEGADHNFAAAAAAAAGGVGVTAPSLRKEARRLYRRALELNPQHAIATHALAALEARARRRLHKEKERPVPAEASAAYGALTSFFLFFFLVECGPRLT